MIPYSPGHEPDLWDPDPEEQAHRFALGRVAGASTQDPPFIAICMNPSNADRTQADPTVRRLIRASADNGYPGWIMLNLYPQRATDAADLAPYDPQLSEANCAVIEHLLLRFGVSEVLGAWGDLKYLTLRRAKVDVLNTLDKLGITLFTFDGLTAGGNPRHPKPRSKELQIRGTKRYLVRSGNRLVELRP